MSVHAVLLVPMDGDPHGLLRKGECGHLPPVVHWPRYQGWDECPEENGNTDVPFKECPRTGAPCSGHSGRERDICFDMGVCRAWEPKRCLVLVWGGQPLSAGLDRAARIGSALTEGILNERAWGRNPALIEHMDYLVTYARLLADRLGCTLVLIDEHGVEITEPG